MNQEPRTRPFESGTFAQLKHKITLLKPYLDHKRFVVRDLDVSVRENNSLVLLSQSGCIKHVDNEHREQPNKRGTEPLKVWQWDEDKREVLQDYVDQLEKFPCCGHKVVVHNPRWADELACPGCETEWSKEFVRERL